MKKILLTIALFVGFAVHADYLYWMVGSPSPSTIQNFAGQDVDLTTWNNAILKVDGTQVASMTSDAATEYSSVDAYAVANIGTEYTSSSTFMIELYQDSSYLGFASSTASALASYIFSDNSMAANLGTGWAPTSYAVPEPTSGLLFLVGGMLLGLRRRRQV